MTPVLPFLLETWRTGTRHGGPQSKPTAIGAAPAAAGAASSGGASSGTAASPPFEQAATTSIASARIARSVSDVPEVLVEAGHHLLARQLPAGDSGLDVGVAE